MAEKINIIIADDHEIYREGIKHTLGKVRYVRVIGEASNGHELLKMPRLRDADVVLIDLNMPVMGGIEATHDIRKLYPWIQVIGMTLFPEPDELRKMKESGISSFILKNAESAELSEAIHVVINGKKYIPRNKLFHEFNHKKSIAMKTRKVLIVDDDSDVINVVETILKTQNYEVITACNKKEGLLKARTEKPDVAILDVMMSTHYEGFELAQEILGDPQLKRLPFLIQTSIDVLTTTRASIQEMAREYRKDPNFKDLQVLLVKNITTGEAGIDYRSEDGRNIWFPVYGFLRKPVDGKKLLQEIQRIIEN